MASALTDLVADAVETMRDFLRLADQFTASPLGLNGSHVKHLRARLAAINEAVRTAGSEEVAEVRASALYTEYRNLLARVREQIAPLHARLLVRRDQLRRSKLQLESARAFASALARTR